MVAEHSQIRSDDFLLQKFNVNFARWAQVVEHEKYEFQELIGNGKPTTWILHAVS
jgi:hypothetical protein